MKLNGIGTGVRRAFHNRLPAAFPLCVRRPVSGLARLLRTAFPGLKAQWRIGTNHSLTVAGAAAELRGSYLHAHRFPVSPRQRNLHSGTLHIPPAWVEALGWKSAEYIVRTVAEKAADVACDIIHIQKAFLLLDLTCFFLL